MRFARWVFLVSGIYGLVAVVPGFFGERLQAPPPVNHPEFYYGFFGAAVAWQLVFLVISRDPVRYRALMLAGVVEKVSFCLANLALFATGRLAMGAPMIGSLIDGALGCLFLAAWVRTRPLLPSREKVSP